MIVKASTINLFQLKEVLLRLNKEQFSLPIPILNSATIGMHTRHVVEFYQCLLAALPTGQINYDSRKRNSMLETDISYCIQTIDAIIGELFNVEGNKEFILKNCYSVEDESETFEIKTNFERELMYNVEHTVHHLALIRVGMKAIAPSVELDETIGVAASTIRNKKICVQ